MFKGGRYLVSREITVRSQTGLLNRQATLFVQKANEFDSVIFLERGTRRINAKSLLGIIEAKFYSMLKTYKKVDLYICPSNFLENKLLNASGIYSGKTFMIHNFIEKNNIKMGKY